MGITVKALVAQAEDREVDMAQMHSSAAEHLLENQRVGGLQIRVASICGLIQMCDGYDVGTIG